MVTLMSSFLGFLKDPQRDPEKDTSIISKVVITGCLKVAKNSIFTGVNNLYVNTVADQETKYTGMIGFTKDETQKILKDYESDIQYVRVMTRNHLIYALTKCHSSWIRLT